MYDIHLSSGCHKQPDLTTLAAIIPMVAIPALQTDLQQLAPGFLGLNLSGDTAVELLEELTLTGGRGLVVPADYRQPNVTFEMAKAIASEALQKEQETRFPTVTFEALQYVSEDAMWWKFGAGSPEWIERALSAGAFYILVDKLDGHVWTEQELVSLNGEEYYLESATTLSPQQILHLLADELRLEWGTDKMNKVCLKGAALVVRAFTHTYPAVIEKMHGIRPTVHVRFRIIPYKTGYESATLLMLQGVMKLWRHDLADAVLAFDAGDLITLLQQISGKLVRGAEWDRWAGSQFAKVLRSYDIHKHYNGVQASDGWNGKPLRQVQKGRKERVASPFPKLPASPVPTFAGAS